MRIAAATAILALTTFGPSAQEPLVAEGRTLVEVYCSTCHSIEPAGGSPHREAPAFRDLHLRYDVDWLAEALVEGLVSGHPDMPAFEFDPLQAEAIIAYLKTLE